jgi:CRP/FNR family transcriptional regulator, cyclic AMP receptor protein
MPEEVQSALDRLRSSQSGFFSMVGADLTEKLLRTRTIRSYEKGALISQRDEPSNHILFMQGGAAKVLTYLLDGREFVVDTLMPGSISGEIDVLRRTKPLFQVHALTSCEVWSLDGKVIRDALDSDPGLSANLLHYVVRRVTELEDRLINLAKLSVSSRLANTLLRLSNGETQYGTDGAQFDRDPMMRTINLSQHELASMLPASREKVNRCLREWERSRIVDLAPGSITITNPRALHAYAVC